MSSRIPARNEIPVEHTWDVGTIFATLADWEAEITALEAALAAADDYVGRLKAPAVLADWFAAWEALWRSVGRIYIYAHCRHSADTRDQAALAAFDRARSLYTRTMAATAFAEPEIIALGADTRDAWMAQEPRLAVYAHYFDSLGRRAAHVRSPEVEALLGELGDPFGTAEATHGVLADTDLQFAPAHDEQGTAMEVGQGSIDALLASPDREVRRTAFESYADAHLAMQNTMGNCLLTGVKQNVFTSRARRYDSALEAALSPNRIPTEVYENVVNTFQRHLPVWHRYWAVRRRALGYERLHIYDIKAPLTADDPRVPFSQAVDWICEGMAPLGDEYVSTMRRGVLEQRWVDIYPNQGKRSGAFSSGFPGTNPFVLMSYTDDLYSLSTLAHELGHSMHSFNAWRTQPFVYADYSIFVAEVASNFNQAMVRDYLFAHQPAPAFQIALIEEAMSNFHRYFFIMPTLARLELELHRRVERGQGFTAEDLVGLTADLFAEGYGDEVVMDRDRAGITWAAFHTHLYSNFYVYQYTTGISAAHALLDRVTDEGPDAVADYLGFLRAGSSAYPLDALRQAGVDLSTPEPIERAFAYMAGLIDRLESLLPTLA